jgi:hypothetical protein
MRIVEALRLVGRGVRVGSVGAMVRRSTPPRAVETSAGGHLHAMFDRE